MNVFNVLLVGLGGFFGAIARFAFSKALNQADKKLPLGTLFVNLSGSFLLGTLAGTQANSWILLLFGTGFLGAFTTFSTLKLELVRLRESLLSFFVYLLVTYGFGILLALLGYKLGRNFF